MYVSIYPSPNLSSIYLTVDKSSIPYVGGKTCKDEAISSTTRVFTCKNFKNISYIYSVAIIKYSMPNVSYKPSITLRQQCHEIRNIFRIYKQGN